MFLETNDFEQKVMEEAKDILKIPDTWKYRDLPRMCPLFFEKFLAIVGEENIHWITKANYQDGTIRGQVFVSPQGLENAKAYYEQKLQ